MTKIDFKKELKQLYAPLAKVIAAVDVPPMNFLMADGSGDPNTALDYAQVVEALFTVAYALKFWVKRNESGLDYVVMPLEGLWWADTPEQFTTRNKAAWQWTMMIMQPAFVTGQMFAEVCKEVEKKNLAALHKVRFERFHEGTSVQILYIGSYNDEGPTISNMHAHIDTHGYVLRGKHHEIYLSDVRKTTLEKLKTVIRQPVILATGSLQAI